MTTPSTTFNTINFGNLLLNFTKARGFFWLVVFFNLVSTYYSNSSLVPFVNQLNQFSKLPGSLVQARLGLFPKGN